MQRLLDSVGKHDRKRSRRGFDLKPGTVWSRPGPRGRLTEVPFPHWKVLELTA